MSENGPETGPLNLPGRAKPAVPPSRPRPERPAYHPTTEIDLSQGFPPVSHETAEIDLSGGFPEHLRVPPRPAAPRRSGRVLGVDVGTVRVGVALSDATGTLASPLETVKRAGDESDLDRLAALVVEHEVTEVVVGEPRHLSGASGAPAAGTGRARVRHEDDLLESRKCCRITTAAAWSMTERWARLSRPASRRDWAAVTVESLSSTRCTGTSPMRPARARE